MRAHRRGNARAEIANLHARATFGTGKQHELHHRAERAGVERILDEVDEDLLHLSRVAGHMQVTHAASSSEMLFS